MPPKKRKVSYFELVNVKDGGTSGVRMEHQNWPGVLAEVAKAKADQLRAELADRKLVGKVYTYENEDQLVIGRVRDDAPPTYDYNSGDIDELEAAIDKGFLEISVVSFLGFGNVVAFMRGPHGSPGVADLVDWLNFLKPYDGVVLEAQPIVSTQVPKKLGRATTVSKLTVRAQVGRTARENAQGYRKLMQVAKEEYGDVECEMTITIRGSKKEHHEEGQRLLADSRAVADSGDVSVAKAKLDYGDYADRGQRNEEVNFITHRVTRTRTVDVVTTENDSGFEALRVRSVVREMVAAAELDEAELRAAVDA